MRIRTALPAPLTVGALCNAAVGVSPIGGCPRLWQPLEVQFEGSHAGESDSGHSTT